MMDTTRTIALSRPKLLQGVIDSAILLIAGPFILLVFSAMLGTVAMFTYWIPSPVISRFLDFTKRGIYLFLTYACNSIKLFDTKPGIVISDTHVIDNASVAASGEIPWSEVTHLERMDFGNHEGITLFIENPDILIKRHSGLKRLLLRLNNSIYGSPVLISANCLKISRDELFDNLLLRFELCNGPLTDEHAPLEAYLVPYVEKGSGPA